MLAFVAEVPMGPAPSTSQASSGSTFVPEQEDMWESDIYPPEAWEGAAYYREQKSEPSSWQRHKFRPSVDKGGEVWESDLYSPEAWESGVEGHDRNVRSGSGKAVADVAGLGPRERPRADAHNEVFWPNIEAYISGPSGSKPTVHCVICQINQLVIAGLQDRKPGATTQEECEVLCCGHVVGAECFGRWETIAARPVKCPVCNAVVD